MRFNWATCLPGVIAPPRSAHRQERTNPTCGCRMAAARLEPDGPGWPQRGHVRKDNRVLAPRPLAVSAQRMSLERPLAIRGDCQDAAGVLPNSRQGSHDPRSTTMKSLGKLDSSARKGTKATQNHHPCDVASCRTNTDATNKARRTQCRGHHALRFTDTCNVAPSLVRLFPTSRNAPGRT